MSAFQPFGVDVAGIVAGAWDGNCDQLTLVKVVAGTYDPAHSTSGTSPGRTPYNAQGFEAGGKTGANDRAQPKGGAVAGTTQTKTGTTVFVLFGNLIDGGQVPTQNDEIIDTAGVTHKIETVDGDGTDAVYMCTCRP